MNIPVDKYPSKLLSEIKEKPIGTAKFKEPVFKLGEFQDQYIEVEVEVYPLSLENAYGEKMVCVRFGVMNMVRFIDRDLLYDLAPLK